MQDLRRVFPNAATSGAGSGKAATAASKSDAGKKTIGRNVATGEASGKRTYKPLVIMREIDKTSPLLMKACASGEHFSRAEVELVENGRTVRYKMSDVIYQLGRQGWQRRRQADGVGVIHIPED